MKEFLEWKFGVSLEKKTDAEFETYYEIPDPNTKSKIFLLSHEIKKNPEILQDMINQMRKHVKVNDVPVPKMTDSGTKKILEWFENVNLKKAICPQIKDKFMMKFLASIGVKCKELKNGTYRADPASTDENKMKILFYQQMLNSSVDGTKKQKLIDDIRKL